MSSPPSPTQFRSGQNRRRQAAQFHNTALEDSLLDPHSEVQANTTQQQFVQCSWCLDNHVAAVSVLLGANNVCYDCIRKRFAAALKSENDYPLKWGDIELKIEDYQHILSKSFVREFKAKEVEYLTPVDERIYCQNKPLSPHDRAGNIFSNARPQEICGAFIGRIKSLVSGCEDVEEEAVKARCKACLAVHCLVCGKAYVKGGHQCDGVAPAREQNEALVGVRGKDFQYCPSTFCRRKIQLVDGCNHMSCKCGQGFCYVCGEPVEETDSKHWARGGCPRYNHPDASNANWDDPHPFHGMLHRYAAADIGPDMNPEERARHVQTMLQEQARLLQLRQQQMLMQRQQQQNERPSNHNISDLHEQLHHRRMREETPEQRLRRNAITPIPQTAGPRSAAAVMSHLHSREPRHENQREQNAGAAAFQRAFEADRESSMSSVLRNTAHPDASFASASPIGRHRRGERSHSEQFQGALQAEGPSRRVSVLPPTGRMVNGRSMFADAATNAQPLTYHSSQPAGAPRTPQIRPRDELDQQFINAANARRQQTQQRDQSAIHDPSGTATSSNTFLQAARAHQSSLPFQRPRPLGTPNSTNPPHPTQFASNSAFNVAATSMFNAAYGLSQAPMHQSGSTQASSDSMEQSTADGFGAQTDEDIDMMDDGGWFHPPY